MLEMALLALAGGVLLGLNRIFIARLGMGIGAFRSSYWNHLVGFLLLSTLMLAWFFPVTLSALLVAPWWAYLGGAIGALFVALNSIVIPRIGATRTMALVICGQMVISTCIDFLLNRIDRPGLALVGLVLLIFGALVPKTLAVAD